MNDSNPPALPPRYHLLDALRGLAALAVVCFHWQNFFLLADAEQGNYEGRDQPLWLFLSPIYQHGHLAVDLFFSLSGFVFFCFYAQKISRGEVSGLNFFVLRFSRLYPLHLLTLVCAAIGQWAFYSLHGRYMAYSHNDLYHFAS